ncbi:hypothetical protein C0Z18_30355 [Trinickia dabaoshanensis]|uniref:Uncharacterized protein n=1 Tax=Trinickia dabaoshanensis TaxID=564714 RepID=A0A2N7VC00_9BURK|nr:hypothetical protein C0Z18_30355 [Trinickia dabaoshanensis]
MAPPRLASALAARCVVPPTRRRRHAFLYHIVIFIDGDRTTHPVRAGSSGSDSPPANFAEFR